MTVHVVITDYSGFLNQPTVVVPQQELAQPQQAQPQGRPERPALRLVR
jgi:hypothetical protein